MPVAAAIKTRTRLVLGVAKVDQPSLDVLLDGLNGFEVGLLTKQLADWDEVKTDNTMIDSDGVKIDPADKRRLIQDEIATLVGWVSAIHDIFIERA